MKSIVERTKKPTQNRYCRYSVSDVMELAGWLSKKGDKGLVKGWKKRWFVFDGPKLYYGDSEISAPLGFIDLTGVLVVQPEGDGGLFNIVVASGRTYFLDAYSADARERWVSHTETRMPGMSRKSLPVGSPKLKLNVESASASSPMLPSAVPSKPIEDEAAARNRKRHRVCQEIMDTETAYLEQLGQLVSCYEDPLVKGNVLSEADKKVVFINVRVLVQIHQELSEALRAKPDAVGAALLSISPLLTFYKDFVNKYHDGGELLRKLNEGKKFAAVLAKCKHGNASGGLNSLENLLVVPVNQSFNSSLFYSSFNPPFLLILVI